MGRKYWIGFLFLSWIFSSIHSGWLVELECTRRSDHRIQRRLKLAEFPLSATMEDLDFAPERGLDRRQVLELAQCS